MEAVCVFFLFGVGILHSIWKATQLVQGMPREAASQRTFLLFKEYCQSIVLTPATTSRHWIVIHVSYAPVLGGGRAIAKLSRARDLDLGCRGCWVAWSKRAVSTMGLTYAWQVYIRRRAD